MLWHRQAIFKSKGDKLCSSAECRIWTRCPRHQIASRLNARWQTDWAIEDQAKKLELDTRPYDQLIPYKHHLLHLDNIWTYTRPAYMHVSCSILSFEPLKLQNPTDEIANVHIHIYLLIRGEHYIMCCYVTVRWAILGRNCFGRNFTSGCKLISYKSGHCPECYHSIIRLFVVVLWSTCDTVATEAVWYHKLVPGLFKRVYDQIIYISYTHLHNWPSYTVTTGSCVSTTQLSW